jgi:hypothetical protein
MVGTVHTSAPLRPKAQQAIDHLDRATAALRRAGGVILLSQGETRPGVVQGQHWGSSLRWRIPPPGPPVWVLK